MKNFLRLGLGIASLAASFGCSCGKDEVDSKDGSQDSAADVRFDATVSADSQVTDSRVDSELVDSGGADSSADAIVVVNDGGVFCGNALCACSDSRDNDGDGRTDGSDPECTGAADNDEGSFGTGIPGDNRDPFCQDCFFDGNSGSGNDGCRYATSCLTTGTPESGSGSCGTCEVSQACIDFCRPLTPNGCDCFGCCEVQLSPTESRHVLLGGSCTSAGVNDPSVCTPCMPSSQCANTCGRCELCAGKTEADLPADCQTHVCEGGEPVCGDTTPCAEGFGCWFGCCVPIIL